MTYGFAVYVLVHVWLADCRHHCQAEMPLHVKSVASFTNDLTGCEAARHRIDPVGANYDCIVPYLDEDDKMRAEAGQ